MDAISEGGEVRCGIIDGGSRLLDGELEDRAQIIINL